MKHLFERYGIHILSVITACTTVYALLNWNSISTLQQLVFLFAIALTLHEWEEMHYPGGFVEMIVSKLKLPLQDLNTPKLILFLVTVFIAFVPLFFPNVAWLAMAPLLVGVVEAIAHTAATRMNPSGRFYSPGMVTALVCMLPVSIYGIYFIVSNGLMQPIEWLYSLLYLFVPLIVAQATIVRSTGMKYSEFLKNARNALS